MNMETYFTDTEIIRQLCKARIKHAKAQGEKLYVTRFVGGRKSQPPSFEIHRLLPPRRQWNPFRPKHRDPHHVADPNLAALELATLSLREKTPQAPWVEHLNAFIQEIRARVLAGSPFQFTRPNVTWELKEGNKYRALCRFTLQDNIISSLFARYMRDLFDPVFEPSSYAFRARPPQGPMPTHHTAFESLYQLRVSSLPQELFVAECDIQGFYDSVDHEVALEALLRVSDQVQRQFPGHFLDPRALDLFRAFLDCYSFPQNVWLEAQPRLKREMGEAAFFPWPEEALRRYHDQPRNQRIGVPQGGAVSCIIANLVLDYADNCVQMVKQPLGADLHYLRYCDDMILVSQCKAHCHKGFQAYLTALEKLKLPYHAPQKVRFYGRGFWEAKSKAPYCWAGRKWFGCVPWVQFVGYQVRYDGLVRIRKKKIPSHYQKLRKTVDQVKWGLLQRVHFPKPGETPIRASKNQVVQSLRQRLISMGVGRIRPGPPAQGPRPMCWANGYKALHGKPFVPTFLRRLDRERERQIRRLRRAPLTYNQEVFRAQKRRRFAPNGFSTSYTAQFNNQAGGQLIQHPYRPASAFERWCAKPFYKLIYAICHLHR